MAQIRQEINILDHVLSGAGVSSNERVQLDTTQYNGTVTYYFEVVAKATAARVVTLFDGANNSIATITTDTSNVYKVYRSTSFTTISATTNYFCHIANDGSDLSAKSARIVIIQEATTLTNTETQIEIGNYNLARTAEAATALTNPKYWKYDASKWDGTKTFYAEAVYDSGDMDTITVALEVSTDILAPSWSTAVTIVSAATTTVATRTRVAFTPTDGSWYRITSFNGSMDNHDIYRAGIVVRQVDGGFLGTGTTGNEIIGGSGTQEKVAQSFKIQTTSTVTGVKLRLRKVGSPTDNLTIDIVSTLDGSSLATVTQAASSLTTSFAVYSLTFDSPVSLTGGSTYYVQLQRSGARDGTNYTRVDGNDSGGYPDGAIQTKSSGSWSSGAGDLYFEIIAGGGITKLEPQYLLANTLLAAGTSLQTFLTDWDSTEWDDGAGSITYYFQGEAADGSTSDMTLQEADGGGAVTNSTLTNIDNAQISAAMTMPSDQNLDVIANANAGDVAAARILVAYVFSAAAPDTSVPTNYQDLIITS